ncbi:MAG: FAD-dependent monooxygenase [Microbacterium sp.]
MKNHPVLIVGAGIGGLSAALALLRKGMDVTVIEQTDALREVGAGVQISPNGNRVLFELGLEKRIREVAFIPEGREVRLWNGGPGWSLPNQGAAASAERYGAPMLFLHRSDLHSALVDAVRALKPDTIVLDARCAEFSQTEDTVRVTTHKGEVFLGSALIGADGVHSHIRQKLFAAGKPEFTGLIAWRGSIPMEKVPQFERPISINWMGPAGSITAYPLRNGSILNFVATTSRSDWQVESWTEAGTTDEILNDFAGWCDEVHEIIRAITTPYKWGLFKRQPATQWVKGRIGLLGDACHSTLPSLGQGANMAIEDGFVLARALSEKGSIEEGLIAYEGARRDRAAKIVNASTEHANRRRSPALADPAKAKEYIATQWSANRVAEVYDWIFGYDAAASAI